MTDLWQHPWLSGLFGDPEMAALLSPEAELSRMLRVEAAWTAAIAPKEDEERITNAIMTAPIRPDDLTDGTARDGLPVPDLVRLLKAHLEEADQPCLHKGLTSQDVIDTSLILMLKAALPILTKRIRTLIAALDALNRRDGARSLMAATRMQAALPITASDRIGAWTRPMLRLSDPMQDMAERMKILQWGGPVGTRDPTLPADTGTRFAAALGLRDPGAAWHSDRSLLAELAGTLSRVSGATGKIGQDIALLVQTEPSALQLTGTGGSSAMPHKQNPVLAELLVTLARKSASDLSLMHHALVHEQERSGSAWMLEWMILPQMLMTTGRSLTAGHDLIGSVARIGKDI
ncbi:MAG: 3-carboxy-cis,cis-muconate cycloisomerase [Pseudomonadota bacterium]